MAKLKQRDQTYSVAGPLDPWTCQIKGIFL